MPFRARFAALIATAATFILAFSSPAFAGSPHFVGTPVFTVSGSTITVSAKEAGLGDEAQVHVVLTATALCVNGGGNHPKAVNKASVTAAADEPVQNGQATYELSGTASFQPACSPPMTVTFTDVSLADTTNGLTVTPVPAP